MIADKNVIDVCTANCNGIGLNPKRQKVLKWLIKHNKGVIFLQETHTTKITMESWLKDVGSNHTAYLSHGTSNTKGVCTLIPEELSAHISHETIDDNGRYVVLKLSLEQEDYLLINVYAPTKDKVTEQIEFLEKL